MRVSSPMFSILNESTFGQSLLASLAIVVPIAIAVIGGVWALFRLRRSPLAERADRARSVSIARGLGILASVVGAGLLGYAAAIGSGWFGGVNVGLVAVFAAAGSLAGIPIWLAGLLGYVVAARPRFGSAARWGAVAGPLLMFGAIGLDSWVVQSIGNANDQAALAAEAARNQSWQDQSARLHVTVEDVEGAVVAFNDLDTGLPRIGIQTARVTLVLHPDVDLALVLDPDSVPGTPLSGTVELVPNDPPMRGCILTGHVPYVGMSTLHAATDTRVVIDLVVPEDCLNQPAAGAFDATLRLAASTDGFRGAYAVTFPITISAD